MTLGYGTFVLKMEAMGQSTTADNECDFSFAGVAGGFATSAAASVGSTGGPACVCKNTVDDAIAKGWTTAGVRGRRDDDKYDDDDRVLQDKIAAMKEAATRAAAADDDDDVDRVKSGPAKQEVSKIPNAASPGNNCFYAGTAVGPADEVCKETTTQGNGIECPEPCTPAVGTHSFGDCAVRGLGARRCVLARAHACVVAVGQVLSLSPGRARTNQSCIAHAVGAGVALTGTSNSASSSSSNSCACKAGSPCTDYQHTTEWCYVESGVCTHAHTRCMATNVAHACFCAPLTQHHAGCGRALQWHLATLGADAFLVLSSVSHAHGLLFSHVLS